VIYWKIFVAFFIPGIIGYGGGPASIPLVENQVIDHYGWMNSERFAEILAIGNALPGPIATKLAGYIGYQEGGILGSVVGIFATVAPSLLLMIFLLGLLYRFKDSPKVKQMTLLIRPTIAVLLGVIAFQFFSEAYHGAGWLQTIFLTAASFVLLQKFKVHPAIVIAGALGYGAIFLSA
jgi:chromate transporter